MTNSVAGIEFVGITKSYGGPGAPLAVKFHG
jgi:hypothetical protein